MKKRGFWIFVFAIIFASSANANIFLGTCDGYVFNMSNGIISGANVTVNVNGCSGGESNGCLASEFSQSNGYYVVANLNVNPSGGLSISATKTINGYNGSGSASTSANQFQAGRANVTLCFPPNASALIYVGDSHNSSVNFYWNSGGDPFGYSTYNEFQLDSGAIQTKTSPVSLNVSYSSHTWGVRTCNTNGVIGCCSPFSQDSFIIYNNAPSAPTLYPVNDTHSSSATFSWINGSDPDNDSIYHQFQFDSEPVQNNSYSPISKTNISFGSHTWRVRACDFMECSSWAEDNFNRTNNAPSAPILKVQANTTSSNIKLNWTSGTDPNGDPIHDEFQFGVYYDFSNYTISVLNAIHPVNITNLAGFEKYYWRVRTCDMNDCSSWSSSSFVKYECDQNQQTCVPSGGGGGGGGGGPAAQKIVEIITPGQPVEVSAPIPATPKATTPAEEVPIPAVVEDAKKIETIPETPTGFAFMFREMLYKNWWILLILLCAILLILLLLGRRKKKDPELKGGEGIRPLQRTISEANGQRPL